MELLDCRRLPGPNLLWDRASVVLDIACRPDQVDAVRADLQARIAELHTQLGWAAPDGAQGSGAPGGAQCWSVGIRTLRLWPDGEVRLNVGGGVVYDSTDEGEWEEALWKARYARGLSSRG